MINVHTKCLREVDYIALFDIAKEAGFRVHEEFRLSFSARPYIAIERGFLRIGATPETFKHSKHISEPVMAAMIAHPEKAILGFDNIRIKMDSTVEVS